jgi:sugar phosphate isomerase/epimerase
MSKTLKVNRREFLAGTAVFAAGARGTAKAPRPGCQANAWNLDPAHFDLLLTAVREMKELGFEGFETNLRFLQPQLNRLQEARAELDSIGLQLVGAHASLPDYEKLVADKAADAIATIADEARKFGAHAVVVSHKSLSPTGEFSEAALERKTKMLNLAGRRCADAGLKLAYHNHHPEFANHAAEENGLLRGTDPQLVSLMLDIGHAWIADPDAISVFAAHPDRAFGLHVRDFHNKVSVPLGQGEFPLKELSQVIRRTGWSGWLIDEEERPNEPDKPGKKATGPSRKAMKAIFGV